VLVGRILGLLLFLVLVVGVAELAAPPIIESRIEETVQTNTEQTVSVRAETRSFPLLTRVAAEREIRQLEVTVDDVAGLELPLDEVELQLNGVIVDRGELLQGRVVVREIRDGRLTAEITEDRLRDVLGVPAVIEDGRLAVELAGRTVEVPVRITDGELRLEVVGLGDFSWPVELDLMPCSPDAAAEQRRIVLTCRFEEVPDVVVRALRPASGAG
jgi:hypothetical protein